MPSRFPNDEGVRLAEAIERARFGNVREGSEDFSLLGKIATMFRNDHPCAQRIAEEAFRKDRSP